MRTVVVLCVLGGLIAAFTGSAPAIPNCSQINTTWCLLHPECPVFIQWTDCNPEQRQWKCVWIASGQSCPNDQTNWQWCWCDGYEGPGCDCMLAGTPITLADGSTKPVEAIVKGDRVLAYHESTATTGSADVLSTHAPYTVTHYFVINEAIRLTENHPLLSRGKWMPAGQLKVGDSLTAADGSDRPIFSIQRVAEEAQVYNFRVSAGTYIAGGIIAHNKEDCSDYIEQP